MALEGLGTLLRVLGKQGVHPSRMIDSIDNKERAVSARSSSASFACARGPGRIRISDTRGVIDLQC